MRETSNLPYVLECFKPNQKIVGKTVADVSDLSTHTNVPDLDQCKRKYCQPNFQCNAFEYSPETKVCDLKKVEMSGLMTGTVSMEDAKGKTLGLDKVEGVCVGNSKYRRYLFLHCSNLIYEPRMFRSVFMFNIGTYMCYYLQHPHTLNRP